MESGQAGVGAGGEVACDESGWEGANLVAGNSVVIAYASVRLGVEEAAECLAELGGRGGGVRWEYKASHVLRADRRSVTRLLGPDGPVYGRALVHLTDKAYFVVSRVLDLVLGQSADTESAGLVADERAVEMADTLIREGQAAFGREGWQAFLVASNAVLRSRKAYNAREPVDALFDLVEKLARVETGGRVGAALEELSRAREAAYAARVRLMRDHLVQPAIEPLIPALARTILYWSRGGETGLSIVHDEQSALTERRIRRLERQLLPAGRCLWFRQVDSRTDPRVQVADVLAGVARRLATDELHGRSDEELSGLLRSYVDPGSRWCGVRCGE